MEGGRGNPGGWAEMFSPGGAGRLQSRVEGRGVGQKKQMSRKTRRIVRMPATRFGHLQKRMRQIERGGKGLPPRQSK